MKLFKKVSGLLIIQVFFVSNLYFVPMNNYYDSAIFYNVQGVDKYYIKKRPWFSFQVSPYMQVVSGCRGLTGSRVGPGGNKLGEGDRLGWWNLLGPFFGRDAAPSDKNFNLINTDFDKTNDNYKNYPNLVLAGAVVDGDVDSYTKTGIGDNFFTQQEYDDSILGHVDLAVPSADSLLLYDFTDETNFNPDDSFYKFGRVSVPIDFEKVGLRSKFNFSFAKYFGMNVKTGVCYYKQSPQFIDKTVESSPFDRDFENASKKSKELINRYLTDEKKIRKIASDVGLDVKRYSKTAMEDTHVEFCVNYPMELEDNSGDLVVTFIPILSFGVWAPSGAKFKQDDAFSLATGNDGFVGLTVDGSLNLDFPGTVQLGFGAGAAFFEKKDLNNQRIPSSKYQYGIYPWKTDIQKQPGTTWYANFSMMGKNFIDDFSFYIDFIHTEHRKDSINLKVENDNFYPQKMIDESSWRNEMIFMGLDYQLASSCNIGISFQSVVGGERVYRTSTILGTMTLNF